MLDFRGASGWFLYTCGTCRQHAFGVQDAANELTHMYSIDDAQLEVLKGMPRATKSWVLLEFLGYMSARDAQAEREVSQDTDVEPALAPPD